MALPVYSNVPLPLRVHLEDIDHLPDLYRVIALYLIEKGDPRIELIPIKSAESGGSAR